MSIRILLADDHTILRQGLRALLQAEPDFLLVGEAASGVEALQKVAALKPDVLVLDLAMPQLNGLEVIRRAPQFHPNLRTVILSMYAREAYVLEALQYPACSYVQKGSDSAELIKAIRLSAKGERYLGAPLTEEEVRNYQRQTRAQDDPFNTLTGREREVLLLTIEGLNTNEIAERLLLSPRTVEAHRMRALNKLGLHSQRELLHYAVQRGLLSIGAPAWTDETRATEE